MLLILLLGAYLRFSDLGKESFWFDEAGIAVSALQPSLSQALDIAHDHVSAMPLDYMVIWLFGRISVEEGFLRLPEAIWGIASIWSVYFFTKKILNKKIALFTSLMVSLAPTHIYLSQELRFYSPLFFFYWLVCGLLFRAMDQPKWGNWFIVIIVSIVGGYFHIFTMLAFLMAPGWFLSSNLDIAFRKQLLKRFFITLTIIVLSILPGFLYFGMETPMDYEIHWNIFISQITIAAGWFPVYGTQVGYLLGFILFLFSILGLLLVIRAREKHLLNLIIITCFQYVLITTAVIISGYFIAWRQYFFTLPVSFVFAGYTLDVFSHQKRSIFSNENVILNKYHLVNKSLSYILIGCLCILSVLTYVENKNFVKSTAREITYQLHNLWQPGDRVVAIPFYTPLLYQFYLEKNFDDRRFSNQIEGLNWENVENISQIEGRILLLSEPAPSNEIYHSLVIQGFKLLTNPSDPNLIWLRDLNITK